MGSEQMSPRKGELEHSRARRVRHFVSRVRKGLSQGNPKKKEGLLG